MSDSKTPAKIPSPSSDVFFDGNPLDLDRLFAHCAIQHLLYPEAFAQTKTLISYLLAHFRGPALDWVAKQLTANVIQNWSDDYAAYCRTVKAQFGHSDTQGMVIARTRMHALKHSGGMREFLLAFEDLANQAGLVSDVTRTTLLVPKLKPYYANAIACNDDMLNPTYHTMRKYLLDVAARHEDGVQTEDTARKKSKCGKCGKTGHSAIQCRSLN